MKAISLWESWAGGKEFWTHIFYWGNNPKRALLKGLSCRILASGKMRSILIEFANGQKEVVDRRAIRRIE
jgi:hypothetical protein